MNSAPAENQTEIDKRYRTTAIIYFSQLFTSAALIVAGWFFVEPSNAQTESVALTPLWIAIIFIAAGAFALRRILTKWEKLRDAKLLNGSTGVLKKLQLNSIILGSLAEAIAVIGFIIAQSNNVEADLLRAGLVSLIVFAVNLPRKSVWQKIIANLEQV